MNLLRAAVSVASCSVSAGRPPSVDELVADLADDGVRWNASDAMLPLSRMPEAVPALEAALDAPDWQQRQLAAALLRHLGDGPPSARLLEVCVEGLRDDDLPYGETGTLFIFNASDGFQFLIEHAADAEPMLRRGLRATDRQQRLLAAGVLAYAGRVEFNVGLAGDLMRVLLPHLRDNDMRGDAILAGAAILRIGRPALPALQRQQGRGDAQQNRLVDRLIEFIRRPPLDDGEVGARLGPWDRKRPESWWHLARPSRVVGWIR